VNNIELPNNRNKIIVVDGSGYIFRAFYAVTELSTSTGFPTNALFGFTRMLGKLLADLVPDFCIVVFDTKIKSFRNTDYPLYKANRAVCPPLLEPQMPFFKDIVKAFGISTMEQEGVEADDIIALLSQKLAKSDHEVLVVSGDKDLFQLVNSKVTVFDPMKGGLFGVDEVVAKLGIYPDQIPDYLGLMGDASDNIPGIKGIGPKTAKQLLEKYGNLDNIISSIETIKLDKTLRGREKIAEMLEHGSADALLSRSLATVRPEKVSLEILLNNSRIKATSDSADNMLSDSAYNNSDTDNRKESDLLNSIKRLPPDTELLLHLQDKFEFDSALFKDLIKKYPSENINHDWQVNLITKDTLAKFIDTLLQQTEVCVDLETTSLDPQESKIVGVSFCWNEVDGYYLPIGHRDEFEFLLSNQIDYDNFIKLFKPIFELGDIGWIGQNIKFDMSILLTHGIKLNNVVFDTMIAAYLIAPDSRSFSLDYLAKHLLNHTTITYEQVTQGRGGFAYVSVDAAAKYSTEDVIITWKLTSILRNKLISQNLESVFSNIEIPLISILADMESYGALVDTKVLSKLSQEWKDRLFDLENRIFEDCKVRFNLNSPKQLAQYLFEILALPTKGIKKTKTGYSTDSSVLEKLSLEHHVPAMLLEYRSLFKLKSTYCDSLPNDISKVTGRIHTKFNQALTGTGRLSSSQPNLQNIPIATEEGKKIREAFIAPLGYLLLSADYSQIELRILAHLCEDEKLIQTFIEGADIHERTAREILGISLGTLTKEQRRLGKTINFGIIYGMGSFRLARELGITLKDADKYINEYFERYPRVKIFFNKIEELALKTGEVRTLLGRKRVLSNLDTSGRDSGFLKRVAINAPIQGTAADVIKLAMVAVANKCPQYQMILQIHDELLFEVPEDEVMDAQDLIIRLMENVFSLKVPLKVDSSIGKTWGETG
jgi:DNA polymerase I